MFRSSLYSICLVLLCSQSFAQKEFTYKAVATDLTVPWEITWGSDNMLWTTERPGIISRINPETGEKQVLLDIQSEVYAVGEAGMLGMTFHPDFPQAPYIYVAYVGGVTNADYKAVVRYEYVEDTLVDPVEIFRLTPGFIIHQGCRLHIGPDRKLYVTMGDHPAEWPVEEDSTLIGKILRMNLDGSVPDDNPVPGQLMWSKGHRNVQGIVRLPNGLLWSCEHGNVIDDEVNLVEKGANYGWPFIEGPCDEEYEMDYCDSAKPSAPAWSSGPGTVAPCGLDYYNHDRYPALKNSLLMATLKHSTLLQFRLNDSGTAITKTNEHLNRSMGRIRDIAISPDGRIFLCTSNHEPNGYAPYPKSDDDKIVELVPIADTTSPEFKSADTVRVKARPGDEYYFSTPIYNTGTSSFRIEYLWNMMHGSVIWCAQWRIPIVVLPGMSYNIDLAFAPVEEGEFMQLVHIGTNNAGEHDIVLIGDTHVGMLEAARDTIVSACLTGEPMLINVPFVNSGTDTVIVLGAEIDGPSAEAYSLKSVEVGELAPSDTCMVVVEYTPRGHDVAECVIRVKSSSYRPASSHLFTTPVVSVEEDKEPLVVSVYPNPAHGEITVVLPHLVTGTISIVDVLGRVMHTESIDYRNIIHFSRTQLFDHAITAGMYRVVVTSENRSTSIGVQFVE